VSELVATDAEPGEIFGVEEGGPRKPRRDDRVSFEITGYDAKGNGIGRVGAWDLVLRRGPLGAVRGARVLARVARRRRGRVEAHVLEIERASPHAIPARCEHAADCGGCRFQELDYAQQLVELRATARRRLAPLARYGLEVPEVLGAADPWRYRNKMDFTFAKRRWKEADDDGRHLDFALGLHAPGRFDKGLDVRACHLQGEVGDRIVAAARELALELGIAPWDLRVHTGFLRHLVVRRSHATDEWLVYLVTSTEAEPRFESFWRGLLERVPEITTLVHGATERMSSVAIGDTDRVLAGDGTITERVAGLDFAVSARSFFQTNSAQAERLFEVVRAFATPEGAERGGVLWDLYCGAGLFGLALAPRFDAVLGVELVPEAVRDARANALRNGVENAAFEEGDAVAWLERAAAGDAGVAAPDLAIVDPPRAGLAGEAAEALRRIGPERLVYVSCHLESGARDLEVLLDPAASNAAPYRLVRTALVDLFPHTPHLEGVFQLERAPNASAFDAR